MNRISLYEALRRKNDAEGLNMAPQGQPVPKQAPRTEPKIQLKQPPKQAAQVVPEKKTLKSPIKLMLTKKTALFRQQTAYQQAWDWLKKVVQSNPRLAGKIGITTGIIIVVILLVFWLRGFGQKEQVQPVGRTTVKNVENRAAENKLIVRQMPPAPAATQQKEKPTAQQQSGDSAKSQLPPVIQSRLEQKPPAETKPQEQAKPSKPVGDHIIVIVAYTKQEDLTPVMAYFKKNGVETEVVKQGSYYLLVTKDRFESPERSGTDGYKMKQTIKRLGANYKAPDGYERFSSTPFQDVYGKKVK
ncbi:MAG: hypothetical protein FJ263_02740 [Planctomycetes bacterium]|nr:hypothetical protein [Planctomycetota bacterium]